MNPIADLSARGQSIWFDYIRRSKLADGELAALVEEGIRGVTSNPAIFEQAIAGSDDYDAALRDLIAADPEGSSIARFEALAIEDIQEACDILRSVYDESAGADGFVSLEVNPRLANDTDPTIAEAKRLWATVDRPNLMIKVPATPAGIPATEELIAAGINVNVTLLFSLEQYEASAQAYIRGLERAADPSRIASVASFFVSRVDTSTDAALEKHGSDEALALRGTIAVANAKVAYRRYQDLFEGAEFADLAAKGARPQRALWASTGTKNPEYSDVLYVVELIGPNTVNTVPPATLDAFRDHGEVRGDTVLDGVDDAIESIDALGDLGIDFDEITQTLQDDGVQAFIDAFDRLLTAIEDKASRLGDG